MLRTAAVSLLIALTEVAALDGTATKCKSDFAAARAEYDLAIKAARTGAARARQAKSGGDRDQCRWYRNRAMAAATAVSKYRKQMEHLRNGPLCANVVPAPPEPLDWPYKAMGFGHGEAGFILFKPLHCGLQKK